MKVGDKAIPAAKLEAQAFDGRTLADLTAVPGASSIGGVLDSGCFGKVNIFRHHGAPVAVKELKAGADEVTIGASNRLAQAAVTTCLCSAWH